MRTCAEIRTGLMGKTGKRKRGEEGDYVRMHGVVVGTMGERVRMGDEERG